MGWIGVDLDGTLAEYHGWGTGEIGKPVHQMAERVRLWLSNGYDVRIFTARVASDPDGEHERRIKAWSLEHFGQELPVTCAKDYGMIALYDDRCVQVISNTGELIDQRAHADALDQRDAEIARLLQFERVVTNGEAHTGWHIMTEDHYQKVMACTCACSVHARAETEVSL